jgi:tetratricopeptide (TPR) repeat protein
MRTSAFICLLYWITLPLVQAQLPEEPIAEEPNLTPVELEVEYFTDNMVTYATLDTNELYLWNKRVFASIEAFLALEKGDHDVMVLITLPKNKPPLVEVSSRPQLSAERTTHLIRRIENLSRRPVSKLTEYAYLVNAQVGRGCQNPQLKFLPKVALPEEKVRAQFEAADLAGKAKLFENWVIEDVLPVLCYYEDTLRTQLRGVNAIGDMLRNGAYRDTSTHALTVANPTYWRATMEIESGNGLVILSKICLHIVNGEYDLAQRYLNVAQVFPEQNSMALNFYQQFDFRMQWLFDDLQTVVRKGRKYQEQGDFESAALYFEKQLEVLPRSAIFNYQKYYSRSLMMTEQAPEDIIQLWKDCKKIVYSCDPLFNMPMPTHSSKEVYLMSKRHEINLLFDNQRTIQNRILEYADIALDLEVYGFAAHLYWLIIGNKPDDFTERDILAHYLYCLERLGDNENIRSFEEEYTRQKFKKIERERQKVMENSEVYRRSEGLNKKNKRKRRTG